MPVHHPFPASRESLWDECLPSPCSIYPEWLSAQALESDSLGSNSALPLSGCVTLH